jgi:pseudouridylate synthase / pseudouridine kinase
VQDALSKGNPVVALESTIISHGMPYPRNMEVACRIEATIREHGATPATIAIIHGVPKIGLSPDDLEYLANPKNRVIKASRRDIAYACSHNLSAATTVASTMILAQQAGIKVFATGGIGGVHRGAELTMDISADLVELGRTPVTVVCGGVKSILDIEKTLEYLETQGVPVIGYNSEEFPAFYSNASGIKSPIVITECESIAKMMHNAEKLGLYHGMVIGVQNPCPADSVDIQHAIDEALISAKAKGIVGQAVTPHILAAVERITQGKSLEANIALVLNNAKVASHIAVEYANINRLSRPTSIDQAPVQEAPKSMTAVMPEASISVPAATPERKPVADKPAVSKIICVGGAVVDMIGRISSSKLILKSSNPGHMSMSYGGVIFNICQHLAKQESVKHDIELISLIGEDNYGQALLNYSNTLGINTTKLQELSAEIQRGPVNAIKPSTATYTAIHGPDGDLCVAVADMSIFQRLSKAHMNDLAGKIRRSDLVVVDGNISVEAFSALVNIAKSYYVPIFFEPTSDHKCTIAVEANALDKVSSIIQLPWYNLSI